MAQLAHDYLKEKAKTLQRWGMLQSERSSWIGHWDELSKNFMPRSARLQRSDRNRGTQKHNSILDNTPIRAVRVLGAGMMSGASSPARPWFKFGLADEDLMEYAPVKEWLADCQRLALNVFARANTYPMLHTLYEELAVFGSHCAIAHDDREKVIYHYNSPTGEYALASDYRGTVNTVYRDFEKPVSELVSEFGYANCSKTVQRLHNDGSLDAWVPVMHVIEPRVDRDPKKWDSRNKAWKSCYFEMGREDVGDRYLREGGFDEFPALAPRWHKVGSDVYGQSPAMDALGDAKQLQHEQLRKANAIDYQTKPPVQAPTALRGQDTSMLPGGIWFVDTPNSNNAIKPLWEVNLNLEHLRQDILDVRGRIDSAFYADLFLMLSNIDRSNMTATEVAERHEEKLIQLGPVLERLHNELLAPLVEKTFARMLRVGMLPPPPAELHGQELNIEFISILAQAQRAVGVNSIDRFVANLGTIAAFQPGVIDKFNADKWAEHYADMMGVDPELIVADEDVALVRGARAKANQEAAKIEQAQMQADAAAKLGTIKTSEPSVATDLLNQFSGYSAPQGSPAL